MMKSGGGGGGGGGGTCAFTTCFWRQSRFVLGSLPSWNVSAKGCIITAPRECIIFRNSRDSEREFLKIVHSPVAVIMHPLAHTFQNGKDHSTNQDRRQKHVVNHTVTSWFCRYAILIRISDVLWWVVSLPYSIVYSNNSNTEGESQEGGRKEKATGKGRRKKRAGFDNRRAREAFPGVRRCALYTCTQHSGAH